MSDALELALGFCELTTDEGAGARVADLDDVANELTRIGEKGGWIRLVPSADPAIEFTVGATAGGASWRLRTTADGDRIVAVDEIVPLLARWLGDNVTTPAPPVAPEPVAPEPLPPPVAPEPEPEPLPEPEAFEEPAPEPEPFAFRTPAPPRPVMAEPPPRPLAVASDPDDDGLPSFVTVPAIAGLVLVLAFFLPWFTFNNVGPVSGFTFARKVGGEGLLVALAPLAGLVTIVSEVAGFGTRLRRVVHVLAGAVGPALLVYAFVRGVDFTLLRVLDIAAALSLAASLSILLSGLRLLQSRELVIGAGLLAFSAVLWPVLNGGSMNGFVEPYRSGGDAYSRCIAASTTTVEECEGLPGDPTGDTRPNNPFEPEPEQ